MASNDLTKMIATDYQYAIPSMTGFIFGVQWLLKSGIPPWTFMFEDPFVLSALGWSVGTVMAHIDTNTQ